MTKCHGLTLQCLSLRRVLKNGSFHSQRDLKISHNKWWTPFLRKLLSQNSCICVSVLWMMWGGAVYRSEINSYVNCGSQPLKEFRSVCSACFKRCGHFMSFHIHRELDFQWLMSFKPGNEINPGIKICPKYTCESRSLIWRCEIYISSYPLTFLAKDFQNLFFVGESVTFLFILMFS